MNAKRNKQIAAAMALLLAIVLFIPAFAGAFTPGEEMRGKTGHEKGHHRAVLGLWRNTQLVEKIGLTGEQIKQVRDADFTFREKQLALKAQLDSYRLQMEKAFLEEIVDETAILQLAEKIATVKGQLFTQKIEARLTLGNILNADQIKQLKSLEMRPSKKSQMNDRRCISANCSIDKPCDQKRVVN